MSAKCININIVACRLDMILDIVIFKIMCFI